MPTASLIDHGLALYFPAPHSYTGEDVLELQAHGGPVLLQMLLARCLQAGQALGLRLAEPGEFTQRAFLNDKLDLAQAEAVADLIDASTEAAARSAGRSLAGVFSQQVQGLRERIVRLRMLVEATLDFPEEEIDFLQQAGARAQLQDIAAALDALLDGAQQGALLREGIRVVLAGQPNVGKSSLLNALAGAELAIVTPIPGTTRDRVSQTIQIEGVPLHVIDTAGLRSQTDDEVERIGIARSWESIADADSVLFLHDLTRRGQPDYDAAEAQIAARLPAGARLLHVHTKCDLVHAGARRRHRAVGTHRPGPRGPAPGAAAARRLARRARRPVHRPRAPRAGAAAHARAPAARARAAATSARRRWSCWPRSCAWRTTRWARSPASSRPTTCWARSSAASASASDSAPAGRRLRSCGRAARIAARRQDAIQAQRTQRTRRWTSPHWSRRCRP